MTEKEKKRLIDAEKNEKRNVIRMTFVFSEEDWKAMGFDEKPKPLELKRAIYDLIHTVHIPELPEYMGASMVARVLNVNQQTVKRYAQSGKIPATKINNRWRFKKGDILEYLDEHSGKKEQQKKIRQKEEEKEELIGELRKIQAMRHKTSKKEEQETDNLPIQRQKKS